MAFDESLAERVRHHFKRRRKKFEEKRMMGGLCFLVNGKMCVGVEKERLMVRLDPEVYEQALKRQGCVPMDFTGRPMRGFVFVHGGGYAKDQDLVSWLELALEFNPKAKAAKGRQRQTTTRKAKRKGP